MLSEVLQSALQQKNYKYILFTAKKYEYKLFIFYDCFYEVEI